MGPERTEASIPWSRSWQSNALFSMHCIAFHSPIHTIIYRINNNQWNHINDRLSMHACMHACMHASAIDIQTVDHHHHHHHHPSSSSFIIHHRHYINSRQFNNNQTRRESTSWWWGQDSCNRIIGISVISMYQCHHQLVTITLTHSLTHSLPTVVSCRVVSFAN